MAEAIKDKVTEEALVEATGRGWAAWFEVLDQAGAARMSHPKITGWLDQEHGVGSWWRQTIAVAYEQERGLRKPGQGADGYYKASASKTVEVEVDELYRAFEDESIRREWLPEGFAIRTATQNKSIRADVEGGQRVAIGFVAKGAGKAQVGLVHEKLDSAEKAAEVAAFWRKRLDGLTALLTGRPPRRSTSSR